MSALLLVLLLFFLYLGFVRTLRYRRRDKLLANFSADELANMTPATAQKILLESLLYESPMIMLLGTQIALFKVYGIANIASLLIKTGQLNTGDLISRRLADTGVLISTWITNPMTGPGSGNDKDEDIADPRGAIAIARVNFLHGKYLIKNDDMRYNLALFMIEPSKCIDRLDWRPHSAIERQAMFVFWREIGRRMGIEGLWETRDEMTEWTRAYEEKHLRPSKASKQLVETLLEHFNDRLPPIPGAQWLLHNIALSLLDDRTRRAMQLRDPSPLIKRFVYAGFHLRAFIVRNLCLPRSKPSHWTQVEPAWPDGRMHAVYMRRAGPWYYPEPAGMARLVQDLKLKLGLMSPRFVPGRRWKSEGYRLEEIGPVQFEKDGHREVMEAAERIHGHVIGAPYSLDLRLGSSVAM